MEKTQKKIMGPKALVSKNQNWVEELALHDLLEQHGDTDMKNTNVRVLGQHSSGKLQRQMRDDSVQVVYNYHSTGPRARLRDRQAQEQAKIEFEKLDAEIKREEADLEKLESCFFKPNISNNSIAYTTKLNKTNILNNPALYDDYGNLKITTESNPISLYSNPRGFSKNASFSKPIDEQ